MDNCLLIVEDQAAAANLVHQLQTQLIGYTSKIEDYCVDDFGFLDVRYHVHRSTERAWLTPTPILKLSSNFLSPQSAHPWAVHRSWPVGFIKSIYIRSHTMSIFEDFRSQFLRTLQSQGWCPNLLKHVDNCTDYHAPYRHTQAQAREDGFCKRWVVLPFNPLWDHPSFASFLRNFAADPQRQLWLRQALRKRVNFRLLPTFKLATASVADTINRELRHEPYGR